jgi:glutamate-ammonia-ligase adenylyltransferase
VLEQDQEPPLRDAQVRRHRLRQDGRQGTRLCLRSRSGLSLSTTTTQEAGKTTARLGQRLNTWLSSQTSAGILFETDLRLRPNGDSGLLAVSVDSFRDYQLKNAWVWEHQALTRARFCAGDPAVGARFEKIRCEILCQQRDLTTLRDEVVAMRQKMLDAHASNSASEFDLKHDQGGIVDVEFIVQYLVLGYAHQHPA